MSQFIVNPTRDDPYTDFRFRVKWDGRYVAGVNNVSALRHTTKADEHRNSGDLSTARTLPGRTSFEQIVLERGLTHDQEFERWLNMSLHLGGGADHDVLLKDFRQDLLIELYNESGNLVTVLRIMRAWVSDYQALPVLDPHSCIVTIQSITLQIEGQERNMDVAQPTETRTAGS